MQIRDLCSPVPAIRSDVTGDAVYQRFEAEPDVMLIAVVDADHRPIGLVERNAFLLRMARAYGRALFAHRPISLLMDPKPLIVAGVTLASDFTADVMSSRPADLLSGFIVVEPDGVYAGVGALLDLLRAASEERSRFASDMFDLARSLETARAQADHNRIFTEAVIEHIPSMVWVKSIQDGRYVMLNRAGEAILGVARDAFIGQTSSDFFPGAVADSLREEDRRLATNGGVVDFEMLPYLRRGEDQRLLHLKKIAICDGEGHPEYILGVGEDITDRRQAEARIERMAHFDSLTDLPNRVLFGSHLEATLDQAARRRERAAVLVIDLDRFKLVNDTLGHAAGDALLTEVAQRMRACIGPRDMLARLGGDEFAIIQAGLAQPTETRALAARVVAALTEPFDLGGHEARIGASIGVAVYPEDAAAGHELLKKADIALYRVKSEGRGAYRFFERDMDDRIQAQRAVEIDLREAMRKGELAAHFQPLFDIARRRIVGFEALMRWPHPTRGWVPPAEFIPIAEDLGLIRPLGEWMLNESCRMAAQWPEPATVAVNISPLQMHMAGFVADVTRALAHSGLAPGRLELEITESVVLDNDPAILRHLHQLREMGVRISLDDFGTGYASLAYLRRLPLDKIKIDQSFIRGLPDAPDAMAIVRAVARLAGDLGMVTTAEGVETEAQLDVLAQLGCTQAQGFLIGHADADPVRHLRAQGPRQAGGING
jgi:diguanylate cyclase (GGDEF)-like protein/PAS domain S-box-containing protein